MVAADLHSSAQGSVPSNAVRARIDNISLFLRRTTPDGVRFELRPQREVSAVFDPTLPLFEGWASNAELVIRATGVCTCPFAASLSLGGTLIGVPIEATIEERVGSHSVFHVEVAVPVRNVAASLAQGSPIALVLTPGARAIGLFKLTLSPVRHAGPSFASLDILESTDSLLFDAPERRLFDLQNTEEGFWAGTGRWRLRLFAEWAKTDAEPYTLETRPTFISHRWQRTMSTADPIFEDATRRAGGRRSYTEFLLDTDHSEFSKLPPEGIDVPLDLTVEHPLSVGNTNCVLSWSAPLPLRLRDPQPLLKQFQRLSTVGIDFGTTATVSALYQRGYRSLMRLGGPATGPAENPTYLLIEDHERLWAEMSKTDSNNRFPNLLRIVRGSFAASEALAEFPNAVLSELKSLPERVMTLDQSPQFRDREKQKVFLLDEERVRILIRTYAYLLGRAINRPGQDVYLRYYLTHPAKFDEKARKLLEEEIRNGILLSIPKGVPAEEVQVSMRASEPEAFAAEVCPELAAMPQLEELISRFGEMRFAVFDFGGGTLDIACGRFRPASEAEQDESGSSTVIETLQVGGDEHLGGDYLTHELVWLTHQHDKHLPEMEDKEVPMMRPATIPPNNLANKAYLYKPSISGRQNKVRFNRSLGLEQVKFRRDNEPKRIDNLQVMRLDGSETQLQSLKTDLAGLHASLAEHLQTRIRDGAKLLRSMLQNTNWGGEGDWRNQGVVLLLAGNSSRSEYVEKALAEELQVPDLKVWRPGAQTPFQQVVLFETPGKTERGVSIAGVTPKTAVALGALRIANREVHLVRRTQGFSYFLGDLRGFPPKFTALIPMGTLPADGTTFGPHFIDFGRWDSQMPLRVCKDYTAGKMTSSDPRLSIVPTGLPQNAKGRLFVCVVSPDEVVLLLQREGQEPIRTTLHIAKILR